MRFFIWSAVVLWIVFVGPLWLLGWGVLHATKQINRAAGLWCRACISLFPGGDS